MSETQQPQPQPIKPTPFKSYGAVLAGFLATAVTTNLVDFIMRKVGVFPSDDSIMSDGAFAIALAYRIVLNSYGCLIAAKLAPYHPMKHAVALGVIGMIAASFGAYKMWDMGPAWYSIANIVVALPCAWIGGKLYEKQQLAIKSDS